MAGIGIRTTADRIKVGKLITKTVSAECRQTGIKTLSCGRK